MSWVIFVGGVLAALLILVLPGFLALGTFRVPGWMACAFSIPATLAIYGVLFIVDGGIGYHVTPLSFLLPLLVVLVMAYLLSVWICTRRRGKLKSASDRYSSDVVAAFSWPEKRSERAWMGGAFLAALLMTLFVFVRTLHQPDAYTQLYDNAWHLGIVRRFQETGNYSTLTSGELVPTLGSHFYPTGWHSVTALVAALLGVSPMLAANAVNTAILAFVLPASFIVLMRWVFRSRPVLWISGSFMVLLFASFPWRFTTFGPLWSNMFSYAILPVLIVQGLVILDARSAWGLRGRFLAIFLVTFVGIALAQPNAIFSAAIVLAIYLFSQMPEYVRRAGVKGAGVVRQRAAIADVILALIITCAWVTLYRVPFMHRTVTWHWPREVSLCRAVLRALAISYGNGIEPLVLVCVILGFLYTCLHRQWLWISISSLVFQFIYVLCDGTEGRLKAVLGGFWYHDYNRLAASAVLEQILLAGMGLWVGVQAVWWAIGRVSRAFAAKKQVRVVSAILMWVLIVSLTLMPASSGRGKNHNAFGIICWSLDQNSSLDKSAVYNTRKRGFVQRAVRITGNGPILNFPYDGSVFAYSEQGTNMYFKAMEGNWMGAPTRDMLLIQNRLNHMATDSAVREAVRRSGAKYVLTLDRYKLTQDPNYPTRWRGLWGLTLRTKGFTLVLQEGDNRLYRIDG